MNADEIKVKVRELLQQLSKDDQTLFAKAIRAEQDKLHMGNPYGIIDDLEAIVRGVVK
ncbi:MAG TPA: hypothetical protein VGK74_07765 [Symbiobacteriaceae bacterium]